MQTIKIDCQKMTSKDKVHPYLKKKFDFPNYYGENLDALWDCLLEINQATTIHLINTHALKHLETYGAQLLELLEDAEEENSMINIRTDD